MYGATEEIQVHAERRLAGFVFLGATVLVGILLQQSLEDGQHGFTHVEGVERGGLNALHVLDKPVKCGNNSG